jgi:hypothetical protein
LTRPLAFDTGPLSAFAREQRLALLEHRYADRAVWTSGVRAEIARGLSTTPQLRTVLEAHWLGDPVRITDPAGPQEIERVRWALGGTTAYPPRHLGEAETIVLTRS